MTVLYSSGTVLKLKFETMIYLLSGVSLKKTSSSINNSMSRNKFKDNRYMKELGNKNEK